MAKEDNLIPLTQQPPDVAHELRVKGGKARGKQARDRYPIYGAWVEGFYRPLIEKTYAHLKDGGVFILQVGSQSYPLIEDGKRLAAAAGFVVEDVRPLGGGTNSALHDNDDEDPDNEKIIVLRKK